MYKHHHNIISQYHLTENSLVVYLHHINAYIYFFSEHHTKNKGWRINFNLASAHDLHECWKKHYCRTAIWYASFTSQNILSNIMYLLTYNLRSQFLFRFKSTHKKKIHSIFLILPDNTLCNSCHYKNEHVNDDNTKLYLVLQRQNTSLCAA